ncbi:hypothetical protein EVAR_52298_1 [Eumeta japonica]|uniref:Uncharacterized protein n=1 Tax=Eumeta variegata TaxID=151549 RepID=A0A4C1Y6T2_EUMVA|nr:hypothetical protein EVAR_52298_1 [Eumeta japonica]
MKALSIILPTRRKKSVLRVDCEGKSEVRAYAAITGNAVILSLLKCKIIFDFALMSRLKSTVILSLNPPKPYQLMCARRQPEEYQFGAYLVVFVDASSQVSRRLSRDHLVAL